MTASSDGTGAGRISRREVHRGRIVDLSVDTVRFPGGSTGELELIRHPGASAVVPFLDAPEEADPRIVLVHQYRYATGGLIWEVPAGMPDSPGEGWEACARRELAEETGFLAGTMHYLTRIYTTPGFTDEVIHLFAATDLREGTVARDHDEFMEVIPLRLSRALRMIRDGEIVDGKSVAALMVAASFLLELGVERRTAPAR